MSDITLYGIPNCDKVRAARKWLDAQGVAFQFHDVRKQGLPEEKLRHWVERAGLSALLNRRSTTWRQLSDDERTAIESGQLASIIQHPTVLKRPILEAGNRLLIGFEPSMWKEAVS